MREIRLQALGTAPGVYHSSLEAEAPLERDEWEALLGAPDKRIFGLFVGEELAGITGVFTDRNDPSGATAALGFSFIRPAYRGRGWTRLLYAARLAWIAARPQYRRAVTSHRASNERSRRAIERHGFVLVEKRERRWHDGTVEDEFLYELRLPNRP